MNIPRFLQLYKEGRLEDAFESVIMDNPLPASTGRVCQHPCESRCRRQTVDEPINMREVHRVIADSILLSDRFDEMAAKIVAKRLPRDREKDRRGRRWSGGADRRRSTSRCWGTRWSCTNRTPSPAACCASPCRNTGCPATCWTARSRSSAGWE